MILSVTLKDGKQYSFEVTKRPKYWKSWVMHQLPYGTNFKGCTFDIDGWKS